MGSVFSKRDATLKRRTFIQQSALVAGLSFVGCGLGAFAGCAEESHGAEHREINPHDKRPKNSANRQVGSLLIADRQFRFLYCRRLEQGYALAARRGVIFQVDERIRGDRNECLGVGR